MHDPQALVGRTLSGKYQVRRLIGQGGMGAVYEGVNVEIGKRVAIKTIDQGHAMSHELATRLKREARAAAAVESSHIVQVFDVGEDPQCGVYMVMEFLSGEDLATKLQRERTLDPQTATSIAIQVGRALVKAHAAGIVHRDLKPGNIFLTEKEEGGLQVKVVDFGISKLLRDDVAGGETRNLTRMGTALGTPQYMSPEQAAGQGQIDHRTDVWALGAVLYEMLSSRPPYDDAGSYEMTIVRILTTRPQSVLAVAPHVPPQLARVIDAALTYEWAQRTPDAQTLVRQLVESMQGDAPLGTGRYSAVSVPGYAPPAMSGGYAQAAVPAVASAGAMSLAELGATMPMSGEHEAIVREARAVVAQQNAGYAQGGSGPHGVAGTQPMQGGSGPQHVIQPQYQSGGYVSQPGASGHSSGRQPISTNTAVVVAGQHDDAKIAGVPSRGSAALLFVGLGALVVALGVGAFVVFGGGDGKKAPASAAQPVETAAVKHEPKEDEGKPAKADDAQKGDPSTKSAKSDGETKPAKSDKPDVAPPAKTVATPTAAQPNAPPLKGGPATTTAKAPIAKAGPSTVASAKTTPSVPTPPQQGGTPSGFGGAGVSENY